MDLTTVKSIYRNTAAYANKEVTLGGWIRTMRVSKNFGFIELNDGSFFKNIQIVFEAERLKNYEEISKQNVGAALIIKGLLVETPEAKQPFEVKATQIDVEGTSTPDYPLQKKRHSVEFLREIAYLRPRTNLFSATFRVRSLIAMAIHEFFQGKGTNLTVSGQLSAETFAMAFRNVYTFGPTFRAENSNTTRHAAEFWMIEPEMAFADLNDNMEIAEEMLKYIIQYVLDNAPEEMEFFNSFVDKGLLDRLHNILDNEFGRVTYTEAVELLKKSGHTFEYPVEWGIDLQTEHERYLTEQIYKKPVFVTDYPVEIKAFYMRLNDDKKTVAAMDLLVPGVGEIIGGSQREERLEVLENRMNELGLKKEDYWWYLDLRKYGGTRHAGFGLGFERAVMYLTGVGNIRDVLPYPRTVNNAEF